MYVLVTLYYEVQLDKHNHQICEPRYIPMVFLADLILFQFRKVLVEAEERDFKSLAALNGVGHRGPSNNKPVVLDAV